MQRTLTSAHSSHALQPNSIEFEMALRWRLVAERLGYAKRQIQARQQTELAAVLASYRKASVSCDCCFCGWV